VLKALLAHPLFQLALVLGYGVVGLYLIIGLCLYRASNDDAIVWGTWSAVGSGFMWYFASIVPLILPAQTIFAAACNIAAAVFAAASAAFLVPQDKILLIRNTFGLG